MRLLAQSQRHPAEIDCGHFTCRDDPQPQIQELASVTSSRDSGRPAQSLPPGFPTLYEPRDRPGALLSLD